MLVMTLMLVMTAAVRKRGSHLRGPMVSVVLVGGSGVLMDVVRAHWIVLWTLPQLSIIFP